MRKLLPSQYNITWGCFNSLLQTCIKSKAMEPGKQIHAVLITAKMEDDLVYLNSILVGMYACCGDYRSSTLVFARIPKPTVFAWNWMISALAFRGDCKDAIHYFRTMHNSGVFVNNFTFSSVLKACVGLLDIKKGRELHCVINRKGYESDVTVANSLIDMYCKCSDLDVARCLFERMPKRDVATWTLMICGYLNSSKLDQSLVLFEQMESEGLEPNGFTWNAMIAGFARNRACSQAFRIFDRMRREGLNPDLATWNAMITGFNHNQHSFKAMELFKEMLDTGIKPNSITIVGLLPGIGSMASLRKGKEIHGLIYRMEIEINVFMSTALIDMYSKCGSVEYARIEFDRTIIKNVTSWNAMIDCYGKHRMVDAAIGLFEKMKEEGMEANQVTFTCLLSACSHAGLVEKGLKLFGSMREVHGVGFTREHFSCMIDLLCRSGRISEAYELVKEMEMEVNDSIVGAFFNGCKMHGRSDLAKKMAEEILQMELKRPGGYVLLSNIYAAEGEWGGVENVRKLMKEKGVFKNPGCSWVQ